MEGAFLIFDVKLLHLTPLLRMLLVTQRNKILGGKKVSNDGNFSTKLNYSMMLIKN